MFKKFVNVVQGLAIVAALFTVSQLALKDKPALNLATVPGEAIDGSAIFSAACAGCHGPGGEGQYGAKLNEGAVAAKYPDKAAQIKVVTGGKGLMPGFGSQLNAEQIAAVVDYTRTL